MITKPSFVTPPTLKSKASQKTKKKKRFTSSLLTSKLKKSKSKLSNNTNSALETVIFKKLKTQFKCQIMLLQLYLQIVLRITLVLIKKGKRGNRGKSIKSQLKELNPVMLLSRKFPNLCRKATRF